MEGALIERAAAIADYTYTSVFVPERAANGKEVPPEWFGMNPDYGEDSAEVIGSSVEEEDEAEDGSKMEAPEDGADGRPHLDRASSNEPCPPEPTAAGGDQAETAQPAAPTSNTAVDAAARLTRARSAPAPSIRFACVLLQSPTPVTTAALFPPPVASCTAAAAC